MRLNNRGPSLHSLVNASRCPFAAMRHWSELPLAQIDRKLGVPKTPPNHDGLQLQLISTQVLGARVDTNTASAEPSLLPTQ